MSDRMEEIKAALKGRYDIERELGRGGMATVYLANDPNFAKPGVLLVNGAAVDPEEVLGVDPLGLQSDPNGFYLYSGTLASDTPYWWRVDTNVYEPNEANRLPQADPNIVYDIPASIEGSTWNFTGRETPAHRARSHEYQRPPPSFSAQERTLEHGRSGRRC